MKAVTMYECEICNELYENESDAIKCESRGKEKALANVGDIVDFYLDTGNADYDEFANNLRISNITKEGHHCEYEFQEKNSLGIWEDSWSYKCHNNEDFVKCYTIIN